MTDSVPAAPTPSDPAPWRHRVLAVVGGLIAAAVALGAAELVAGLHAQWRSPVLDVGDRVIDNVPSSVKDLAIDWFGTNDKVALLVGIGSLLAIYAMALGVVALGRGRLVVGLVGIAAFGLIGAWAANGRRARAPWHVVTPSVVGALAGLGAMLLLHRTLSRPAPSTTPVPDTVATTPNAGRVATSTNCGTRRPPDGRLVPELGKTDVDPARGGVSSRRGFLGSTAATFGMLSVFAALAAGVGRKLASRFTAAESRADVVLPRPSDRLEPLPSTVEVGVDGVSPFVTPNESFYRIDTALTAPQVSTAGYTLRIHGLVDDELELSYDELLARPMIERDITMTCVSNEVGGTLVGNARWLGTRLDDLLREAGVRPDADQVVGRSADGYECGFPADVALDGRDALVVVGMNGEPLPIEHGFPVRLVVPGLYGYVSATKWLTEIELTTFADFDHYWLRRGWAREAPIKLMSRIDTPRGLGRVSAGTVPIAGVAWAQTVGIAAVDVQIDDGDWLPAQLATAPSDDTWVQWVLPWDAAAGRHGVRVRATDKNGAIQTDERAEPIPDGASGLHQIVVIVE